MKTRPGEQPGFVFYQRIFSIICDILTISYKMTRGLFVPSSFDNE